MSRRSCIVVVMGLLSFASGTASTAVAQNAEFRGFWADVFHVGYKSAADVDALVARAVAGGYNVILPEMMAYQDNALGSHGAYWRSNIIARSSYVTDAFDPLAYLVQRAHANGIQVHPWLVAFRASSAWPPAGNTILAAHPEYLMVPSASMGTVASVGGDYQLDPGSPDVQEYLVSIVRELVTNYDIDGIHWDYIRYTQADAGYPTNTSYANSSLARFKRITGYTGTPASNYAPWSDFRRRSITELIRRVRVELAALSTTKPLRHSASLITWGSAPSTFSSSSAYGVFQNWEEWMRLGFLDTGIPMTYYDYSVNPTMYTSWVNKEMAWRYQRQMVVGPGIYMNTFADSLTELNYARNAGADGVSTYSYWATKKSSANDWTWYDYVAANFFTSPATVPAMPWRDPATATEGTLWGRVTRGGMAIDNASVQVGTVSALTDANGYYVVTMLPPAAYQVVATSGTDTATHSGVQVTAGEAIRDDISLDAAPAPMLNVSPASGLASSGQVGGPFSPASLTYTVSNTGTASMDWTVAAGQPWVSLDKAGGTLAPGASDTVTVSINAEAGNLAVGSYSDTVVFTNVTDGQGNTTRAVSLTVQAPPQPGVLTISPAGGLTSSGNIGGPFTPASMTYTVSNTGELPIDWTAAATQVWVSVSKAGGTLAAGASDTVMVSINSGANGLAIGSYADTVTFTNVTNGNGNATRSVSLMVNSAPGVLSVTPSTNLSSSGRRGGPFTPSSITYTLTNTGPTSLNFTVKKTRTWVTLSQTSGTLAPGASTTVVVSINSGANSLNFGTYTDTVTFTNASGPGSTTRTVTLTVRKR